MKRQKWKRFLAAILTAVMCLGEIGGTGMTVFAQDDIPETEEAVSEDDAASENDAVSEDAAEEDAVSEDTAEEEPAEAAEEEQQELPAEEPDADGNTYNLWVGGVQVTDKNKADIPGVTGGKASYDPASKTLTLTGVRGFKGGYYPEGTLTPYVYSEIGFEDGFRITGDAEFTTPDIYTNGFYLENGGSVNGDFTISGKASGIYGDTGVLTIEGGNIKLETEASVGLRSEYLTISGGTLDVTGKADGIHCLKEMWINAGDVKASGAETGIIATDLYVNGGTVAATATGKYDPDKAYENTVDGITVRNYTQLGGTVTARGDVYGLAAYDGDIKLENEAVLDARCPNTNLHIKHKDLYIGVYADKGSIWLNGGWLTCEGGNESYSIRTTVGDIVLGEGVSVLDPENGFVSEEYRDGYIKAGKAIFGSRNPRLAASTDGVISVGHKDVTYYGLCLGDVEVTPLNQADIPIKSGKASYDPATKTLKCEDAVIETFKGIDRSEAILTYDDLTITGKLTINKVDDSGYGILAEESSLQFVDADVTATGMKYGAIRVTDVKVGSIKVINSKLDVSAMSDESGDCAIWAGDRIILDRACIKASSGNAAMACGLWFDGEEKHTIVSPANAFFGDKQITDRKTMGPAKSVEIQPLLEEGVWISGKKVNYSNKDDVLGDGKISYDPNTKTFRFKDAELISWNGKYGACVYSDSDLRIEGSVKLDVNAPYGIRTKGSLTLNADIEGTKLDNLVYSDDGAIYVEGGEIKGTVTESGLAAGNELRISGGKLDITAGNIGLCSLSNIVISGGDIKLIGSKNNSICVKAYNADFIMNGGRLYAKTESDRVIYVRQLHITENDMRIALPEGGYEYGKNMGDIVDPKTGRYAKEVLIYKKGTQDCVVSFDMGGHGTAITAQTIKDGGKATRPSPAPSDTDYLFVNWYADEDRTQLFDFDKEVIKDTTVYALWYEKGDYELWLGDTLVTDANCTDIFGDGKASYNPTTHTLTLKDYTGNGKYCTASELGEGDQAMIFAKQDLTIKGSASLSSNTDKVFAIGCLGGLLTIDADMDIKLTGKSSGGITAANGNIHFDGGQVNITVSGEDGVGIGFAGERFELNGASVTVYASVAGLYSTATEEGKENNVILNDGLLDLTVDKSESWLVVLLGLNFPLAIGGKLEINGGTLKAKHNNTEATAVAIAGAVYEPDYVEFVKPAGGSFKTEGPATYVVDGEGKNANEVELVHKQCTVTFDLNGKTVYDGTAPEPQKVYAGKTAQKPEDPVAEGFAFKGWFKDQACTEEFDFIGTDITEDITLYAKWAEGFTVEFNTGYDDVDEPFAQSVEEGNTVERPRDPVAEGRKFLGWFLSLEDTEPYDFTTPVTKSFTLYAKWEKEKHTVTFDENGHGTAPAPLTVDHGDAAQAPKAPEADGYKFLGWYEDKECLYLYDFRKPVEADITLYAKWVDAATKTWTVSFDLNGMEGTAPDAQTVIDGECAYYPEEPVVPGRIFMGWYKSKSCRDEDRFVFSTTVTSDLTLYAKWGGGEEIPGFTVWFVDCAPGPEYGSLAYNSVNGHYEVAYTSFAMKPPVEVRGADGVILTEGTDYIVKYSNNVNVSTKKAAKVTVKGKGNFSGSKELEFYILPADLSILKGKLIVVPQQYAKDGKPVAELYYGTYKLKAKDVELPKEKITEAKELEIKGKGNFCGSIKEVFTPISKADVKKSTLKITLSTKSVVFNGMEQRPEVKVTAADGTALEQYTDYVVSYSNNYNAGKAAVVVEGRGKYYGGASATFTIKPDTTSQIAVKSESAVTHNPAGATVFLLVAAGGRILREGEDYTVKYSNNKKVGTGQAVISFIGNYKGQKAKKQSFKIEAAPVNIADFFVGSMTYSKPGKYFSKVYVTDEGVLLKEKKDYTVSYYTDAECTQALPAKYTMEADKSQVVLYAKVTGIGNYNSDTSKVISFVLYKAEEGKLDLSKARIVDPATGKKLEKQEYTGRAVEPAIKVQVKVGKTWTDVDPKYYTVSYSNNVAKGKATVVVSGKGTSATGSKSVTFSIRARDMKGFEQGKIEEK